MEKIPQQAISQMREGLEKIDIPAAKKLEMHRLLNKIEGKEGMAPKEIEKLGKLIAEEEGVIRVEISLATKMSKVLLDFMRKGDRILKDCVAAIKKKVGEEK